MAPPKKRKHAKIEEISFDADARQEYLSGFHKRKQARVKAAQEAAAIKEKEDRKAQRREVWQFQRYRVFQSIAPSSSSFT
jgi:ribosomal RNA-processing protein 17